MTKFSSLARARMIGPEGGAWGGGAGEGVAGVDILVVSSSLCGTNFCINYTSPAPFCTKFRAVMK